MKSLSHSRRLRTKIRLAEPCLLEVSDHFWTHAQLAQMFPEFLFLMHSIIRSSVSLINAAAESSQRRADSDLVCRKITAYYKTHGLEEMHHDDWLLEDMAAIGMERSEVLVRLPSPAVASLVGAQYYWALHVHPVALFGYLAVLEGSPPSLRQLNEIRTRNGLPAEGLRTIVKHSRLDPHHRDEIYAQLDDLPLNRNLSELVALSAFHTIEHISQALQEILDSHRNGSVFKDRSRRQFNETTKSQRFSASVRSRWSGESSASAISRHRALQAGGPPVANPGPCKRSNPGPHGTLRSPRV